MVILEDLIAKRTCETSMLDEYVKQCKASLGS